MTPAGARSTSWVGDILIEREAVAQGTSRDELLAQELPPRTLPVTEARSNRSTGRTGMRSGADARADGA